MENFHINLKENERLDRIFPPSKSEDKYLEEDDEEEAYEHTIQRGLETINRNMNDIWVSYGPSEWSKSRSTYDPQPMEFIEENVRLTHVTLVCWTIFNILTNFIVEGDCI